jgi:[ribosomal protein S5]-alanine N-acetyltransferase
VFSHSRFRLSSQTAAAPTYRPLEIACKLSPMIKTARLTLRLMSESFMRACLEQRVGDAETLLGASLSPAWFEEMGFLAMRVEQLRQDPDYTIWGPRAVVLESVVLESVVLESAVLESAVLESAVPSGSARVIGHIGFHGKPNQPYLLEFVPDGIEFGYTIDPAFRRQGFALEASLGLMRWAALEWGISRFVLSVSPGNLASQGVAAKLGFRKVGEHMDLEDGLEEVFELTGQALSKWLEVSA